MAVHTWHEWEEWHKEREAFQKRDAEGITQDMAALKAHILKLQEVCPKDKAGWPVGTALRTIDQLTKDYNRFARYLVQLR